MKDSLFGTFFGEVSPIEFNPKKNILEGKSPELKSTKTGQY